MPDEHPDPVGEMPDAPNQQVVRPDGSAPWDEGNGGSSPDDMRPKSGKAKQAKAEPPPEPKTKDEADAQAKATD